MNPELAESQIELYGVLLALSLYSFSKCQFLCLIDQILNLSKITKDSQFVNICRYLFIYL